MGANAVVDGWQSATRCYSYVRRDWLAELSCVNGDGGDSFVSPAPAAEQAEVNRLRRCEALMCHADVRGETRDRWLVHCVDGIGVVA